MTFPLSLSRLGASLATPTILMIEACRSVCSEGTRRFRVENANCRYSIIYISFGADPSRLLHALRAPSFLLSTPDATCTLVPHLYFTTIMIADREMRRATIKQSNEARTGIQSLYRFLQKKKLCPKKLIFPSYV